ncbi:transposase [Legionella waltersii]|nr:transposase [Legionella waltersii]
MLVRWYLAYSLSYRDVEELALERGLKVDHSTIHRWLIECSPLLCILVCAILETISRIK